MADSRLGTAARMLAVALVAAPALLIGGVLLYSVVEDPGPQLNYIFHLTLALILFALLAEFAVAIVRSRAIATVLALGAGGFLAVLASAALGELFGPLFVVPMAVVLAVWGGLLAFRPSRSVPIAGEPG